MGERGPSEGNAEGESDMAKEGSGSGESDGREGGDSDNGEVVPVVRENDRWGFEFELFKDKIKNNQGLLWQFFFSNDNQLNKFQVAI